MRCEIGGCYNEPVETHHIRARGAGGTDGRHNKIRLCIQHHRGDGVSVHQMGTWAFADKFGLRERFENAFAKEREIEQKKRERLFQRTRAKKEQGRRICPTCKRSWSKGILVKPRGIIEYD